MFGGISIILLALIVLPFLLLTMVIWIWALVAALTNQGLGDGEKVGWVLAILFLHFLGGILYFIFGHPKRKMPITA